EFGEPQKAENLFEQVAVQAEEAGIKDLLAWAHYAMADLLYEQGRKEEAQERLQTVSKDIADDEFQVRLELLQAKLKMISQSKKVNSFFKPLEATCQKNQFQEILWEVYQAWGKAVEQAGRSGEAKAFFEKGISVLRGISESLPEEYRDRYLNQKGRQALFESFKRLSAGKETLKPAGVVSEDRRSPVSEGTKTVSKKVR
ncbi:MAG: tetratricopeptide repeat protein, partial [bacterium]|nr:tetratricopeptide repeat protein [bacterium]